MDAAMQLEQESTDRLSRWDNNDELEAEEEEDDNTSLDSDSGISLSSWSCESTLHQYEEFENDNSFIVTVAEIARDIAQQSPAYTAALMDFTSSGLISNDPYIRRSAAVFIWQLFRACNMPYYDDVEVKEKMMTLLKYETRDIIKCLQQSLELDTRSDQMLYWVSGCLHYISRVQYGAEKLWRNHVQLIISLLDYNLQAVVFYAITTLHNILLNSNEPLSSYETSKSIELIIQKLNRLHEYPQQTQCKLFAICIDCLSNLSYHNEFAKSFISSQKNPDALNLIVKFLNEFFQNEKLLLLGLRLLKILSTNADVKKQLSKSSDYLELLRRMFELNIKFTSTIWSNALWTLRNLSDTLFRVECTSSCNPSNINNVISCNNTNTTTTTTTNNNNNDDDDDDNSNTNNINSSIDSSSHNNKIHNNKDIENKTKSTVIMIGCNEMLLHKICLGFDKICRSENDILVQCAAGVLANASCDCPEVKQLLVKTKVPETIVRCLSKAKFTLWSGETLEALYRCMHHLCSNHPNADRVVHLCVNSDLDFLINILDIIDLKLSPLKLKSTSTIPILWSVLRAWLGLVRHLCVHHLRGITAQTLDANGSFFLDTVRSTLNQIRSRIMISSILVGSYSADSIDKSNNCCIINSGEENTTTTTNNNNGGSVNVTINSSHYQNQKHHHHHHQQQEHQQQEPQQQQAPSPSLSPPITNVSDQFDSTFSNITSNYLSQLYSSIVLVENLLNVTD